MGEIDGRLNPEDNDKLSDAAPLGRSRSTMSASALTEYAGAAWIAFNELEARVAALDSGATGFLLARVGSELGARLTEAGNPGRSPRKISKTDLTEFAGALYAGYDALTARVNARDSAGLGNLPSRLETEEKNELNEAAPIGRSRLIMNAIQLTEWAGATDAAYSALEARVAALESGT